MEEIDPETVHKLFSNVFDSKIVGDLTKWRFLASASVLFLN
jgi:hypothetical protein